MVKKSSEGRFLEATKGALRLLRAEEGGSCKAEYTEADLDESSLERIHRG